VVQDPPVDVPELAFPELALDFPELFSPDVGAEVPELALPELELAVAASSLLVLGLELEHAIPMDMASSAVKTDPIRSCSFARCCIVRSFSSPARGVRVFERRILGGRRRCVQLTAHRPGGRAPRVRPR